MKTTNIVTNSISSGEVGENAIAMSMDASSTVFLMDMLGKLYARPALAVLREYLSNAHDAHVAKGGKLPPIEITLPHGNSKLLTIRDYGNGISEEQFSTILSRYGKSTKRDSNEFIGGFGLGAKAGFALNDEFFMTSHQNGTGLRARFYKDAKNQGYVEVVERFQTPESDGVRVEVQIPTANLGEFSDHNIKLLFLAYGPDAVQVLPTHNSKKRVSLLDPKEFAGLEFDGKVVGWVSKRFNVQKPSNRNAPNLYVAVGKVVYGMTFQEILSTADDEELERFSYYANDSMYSHVLNIPINSVDLPSSREAIILSERSLRTLRGALKNHIRLVHSHYQSELNKAEYLPAMRRVALLEIAHYPNVNSFTWRGKKLGAELLASSNMIVKVAQNKRNVEFFTHSASQFESAESFIKAVLPITPPSNPFLLIADTEGNAKTFSLSLTESVVRGILSEFLPQVQKDKSFHTSILIVMKDDPLYEMVSGFPVLDSSVIETAMSKEVQAKRRLAKCLEQERQNLLAEEAAKKAEEARMLHSFFVRDPAARYDLNQFVEREGPEKVFCNETIAEVKYYWSQEELLNLNEKSFSIKPAFPYFEPEENVYEVHRDPECGPNDRSSTYHQRLREFLNHFLLPGSRVILLNTNADLASFKAEHPEVRSGVNAVKAKVEEYLKDETSDIMTLRGMMTPNYRVSSRVPTQVMQFASLLNEEQEDQLHPSFMETVDALERVHRLRKDKQYINERYLEAILSIFCDNLPAKPDIWGPHENMEEKYPLFFFGATFTPKVIPELIAYINMKNA